LAFAGLLALAGVSSAQARDIPADQPQITVPASFAGSTAAPATSQFCSSWWQAFGDPQLDALIARMHAGNTTIQQSAARLAAARAQAHLGAASRSPQIGFDATASHASGPIINDAGGSGSLYTARLSVSWEADLLGRLSGQRKAERLDAKAAEAMLRDTNLLMEAETARAYFETVYLQQAEASAIRQAALWQEREAIAADRARHGFAPQIDIGQLRQRSIASAAEAAELSRQLAEARGALGFLVGEPAPLTAASRELPSAPEVPAGLPSQVLARRPDVDAAASRLEAADSRLQSARRSWLPMFSLTASGGGASPSLGQILSASARDFGAGLLFSLPLFDGGRHKAQVAGSKAERALAESQYREAMLAALREVNDALAAVEASGKQVQLANESLTLGESEAEIQTRRAAIGTVSRAQLLESELAESRKRQEALGARYADLVAAIDLIKAIGGGWSAMPRHS
jgi:multidrug efflux system outer membrane protein